MIKNKDKKNEAPPQGGKEILNVKELCNYLGISRSLVYKLSSTNQLPKYSPGGKLIYFRRSEVDEWVCRNRIGACTDTDIEHAAITYVMRNPKGEAAA